MEGALPSVVGGLIGVPLVAVPTSVGYGASFGGVAALLAMLNSCAPGVTVVNIDNGYGAGVFAARVARRRRRPMTRRSGSTRPRAPAATCSSARCSAPACRSRCSRRPSTRSVPEPVRAARGDGDPRRVRRHPRATSRCRTRSTTGPGVTSARCCSSAALRRAGARPRAPGLRAARRRRGHGARHTTRSTCTSTRSAPSTRSPTSSVSAPASCTSAPTEVVVSPVAVGSGSVRGAHGTLPVPPPAVVRLLLTGVPSYAGPDGAPAIELCTPTGAALLTTLGHGVRSAAADDRRRPSGSARAAATPRATPTCCACWSASPIAGRTTAPTTCSSSRPTSTTSTRGCGPRSSPRCWPPARSTRG